MIWKHFQKRSAENKTRFSWTCGLERDTQQLSRDLVKVQALTGKTGGPETLHFYQAPRACGPQGCKQKLWEKPGREPADSPGIVSGTSLGHTLSCVLPESPAGPSREPGGPC